MAADGLATTAIAQRLDVDVVSRWRKPFAEGGLAGLADRKRTGPAAHVHRTGGRR
jgi:Winged helix-turn helix